MLSDSREPVPGFIPRLRSGSRPRGRGRSQPCGSGVSLREPLFPSAVQGPHAGLRDTSGLSRCGGRI